MATRLGSLLRHLLRRVPSSLPGEVADADLLERFTRGRDEAAFELLLWRHGPMVLSLCQRLLPGEQDAEDAFQATFLVLVRKARSISKHEALASWLYKVAYRVACRARPGRPVLSNHAEAVADVPAPDDSSEIIWRDLRPHLDEEIARLPESYRRAVVLCYFEGKTNDEAAQLLGWPRGTVATRLARARERLRRSMARRGWTVTSGILAMVLAERAVAGPVTAELVRGTLRSAVAYASGQAAVLSAKTIALTEGVLRIMWYGKLKLAAGVMLVLALIGTGLGVGVQAWAGGDDEPAVAPQPPVRALQGGQKVEVDRLRREIASLREELEQARKEIKDLRDALRPAGAPPDKGPVYRGKPVVFWLEQAKDGDPGYRKEAMNALGTLALHNKKLIPALMPTLLNGLKDDRSEVNGPASSALGDLGAPVVPALVEILKDQAAGSARSRALSALAMNRAAAKAAVPVIIDTLNDENMQLRRFAVATLGDIGPEAKAAVPALIQVLKQNDEELRRLAADALGGIGPDAKAAIPWLMHVFEEQVIQIQKILEASTKEGKKLGTGAFQLRSRVLSNVDIPGAVVDALRRIDPAIRELLPTEPENRTIDLWPPIYDILKKRYESLKR